MSLSEKETGDLWELLHSIDKKLDMHLEEELKTRPKLEELIAILERSKGAVFLVKVLLGVVTPLMALLYWAKDHVKL